MPLDTPGEAPAAALTDVATLRQRARQDIDDGAVTAGYSADRTRVLALLNEALATELVCVLRYRRHHFMARGIHAKSTADEFLANDDPTTSHLLREILAVEEQHADELADLLAGLPRT